MATNHIFRGILHIPTSVYLYERICKYKYISINYSVDVINITIYIVDMKLITSHVYCLRVPYYGKRKSRFTRSMQ